jgi:short-subunit dehydrogenase
MFTNIIITGASSGLGASLAKLFAAPGVKLGLLGRDRVRLEEVAGHCRGQGATVETICMDVREREKLVAWIENFDNTRPVDLIIANAGVMHAIGKRHPAETKEMIEEIFAVNVTGAMDTINPMLERMQRRGRGNAVVISSLSAYRGMPTFPAYAASKAAVKSYYEAVRGVYARKGVTITVVCPSYIETRMTAKLKVARFLLMDVDRAAKKIQRGINRNHPLITFPWHDNLGLQLLRLLPERLADRILLAFLRM